MSLNDILGDNQTLSRDSNSPATQFDPPRQSRLLAFGAQNPRVGSQAASQSIPGAAQIPRLPQQSVDPLWPNQIRRPTESPVFVTTGSQQVSSDKNANLQHLLAAQYDMNNIVPNVESGSRRSMLESIAVQQGFPLVDDGPRSSVIDSGRSFTGPIDQIRTSSIPLSVVADRNAYMSVSDSLHNPSDIRGRNATPPTAPLSATSPISVFDNQLGGGQSAYSTGKGSRMAKHFEKHRESQSLSLGRASNIGMGANGILSGRQELQSFGNTPLGSEAKGYTDIIAMLTHSAQVIFYKH